MGLTSEIFLTNKQIDQQKWSNFIKIISNYQGLFKKWKLVITIDKNEIHYYVQTKHNLPSTIHNLNEFLLKQTTNLETKEYRSGFPIFHQGKDFIDTIEHFEIKKKKHLTKIEINFRKINTTSILSHIYFYFQEETFSIKRKVLFTSPTTILALQLDKNSRFFYKSVPKYLEIEKIIHLLQTDKIASLLQVDTFPYLQGNFYLNQNNYDFAKHSLILGSSGAGKSKFISLFIHNLYKTTEYRNQYRIVVIDPHAALEKDIGGIAKVIDFHQKNNSIHLFHNNTEDIISSTELFLELFKSLMEDQYNSKLERVLRHAIHILLSINDFQFSTLRKLLLDTEYRTLLLKQQVRILPTSVTDFFLSDFNDLKTKSYGEAISPIISFIDEMEMIPVFGNEKSDNTLKNTIHNNFLTIFSLDKTKFGDKSVKTISGLIMQQLLTLVQSYEFHEHIIFIIDEVAVVENPILSRFLSEARKYNLSLMLASQYFNQISDNLKNAIFANTINYYLFRVSRTDASLLANHLPMKIPLDDKEETKVKLLSELNNRECVARISSNGILLPSFKTKTLDYTSIPRIIVEQEKKKMLDNQLETPKFDFQITSNTNLKDILITHSSQRGGMKNE